MMNDMYNGFYENIRTENGKYTFDGYDFFDTVEEAKSEWAKQVLWTHGLMHKDSNDEWVCD